MKSISYEEAAAFGDPVACGAHVPNHDFLIQETTPRADTKAIIQLTWNAIKHVQFTKCGMYELDSESRKYIVAIFYIKLKPVSPEYKERTNFNQRAGALKNRLNPA